MNNSARIFTSRDDQVDIRSPRTPPHSPIAEESVLGAVLLDNEAVNLAMEIVRPEDFYRPAHSAIFKAMVQLCEKRSPVDVVTLGDMLKSMSALDEVGGFEYIGRLAAAVPSAANVAYYAKIVQSLSMRRKVIHEASEIIEGAFSQEGEVEDFLDSVETRILGLSTSHRRSDIVPVGDLVQDSIRLIEKLLDKKELVTGVSTGFIDLDRMTAGMQASDLIIVAARPSMGKTAFALNLGAHAALRQNRAVAVAEVDNSRVRTGHLGPRDFPNLMTAAAEISETKLYIDDTPALTPTELRAKCRRLHRETPLSLVIVDYLQLMRSPAHAKAREQEISYISRSLKALAKELQVPVVALSQLNRSVESRTDKRPLMSDLRESGAIEQDADIITFIYRDEVYNENSPDKGVAEIIISKQRNGPTGVVKLAFSPNFTRFDNLAYDDEIPGYIPPAENGFDGNGFDHTSSSTNTSNELRFDNRENSRSIKGTFTPAPSQDLYDVEPDTFLSEDDDPLF
jgi:replicative DNA helicase